MSFQAMAWAVEQDLPMREKMVLLILANYASNERGDCHPSVGLLAKDCGASKDSIIRAIKSLEDRGLVTVNRRVSDGVNLPNTYTLNMRGVVAESDHRGSSTQRGGVVAESDTNLSLEPITTSSLRSDESASARNRDQVSEAVAAYSEMASRCGLPAVRMLNDTRRRKIASLLKNHGFAVWIEALAKVEASDFCLGRKGDFRADLDFILQPQSFTRILEGRYDNRGGTKSFHDPPPKPQTVGDIFLQDARDMGFFDHDNTSNADRLLDTSDRSRQGAGPRIIGGTAVTGDR